MNAVIAKISFIGALMAVAANAQTAAPADSQPPATTIPAVKIIPAPTPAQRYKSENVCRSSIETGSLIKRHKACLTAKQWDYVDQQHRDEARKMMMDNMGRPPG